MTLFCRNGSECCMKCPFLGAEERIAAHEHHYPSERESTDRCAEGYCNHYCGRFEADQRCLTCSSREMIAARAREIKETARLGVPYSRKGWVCHGL